jgi:exopolysaccharide/PEP-CTERM locus tyrosine autokinase
MGIIERAVEVAQSGSTTGRDQPAEVPNAHPPQASLPPLRPVRANGLPDRSNEVTPRTAGGSGRPVIRLDCDRLREMGRLPPADSARRTADEMRRIKWPLLGAIRGREGADAVRNNVILVTSALPGEGKSFVSLNLALSLVRDRDLHVILVDGDVARPGLTPALGLEGSPGLNDILEDANADVGSVTYATDVEGLFVVPAGKWHDQAPELLASARMPQVIEELNRRAGDGVIILDSPPLLATNEAQVVSRHVGQVLLVVRADGTEQRAVRDAIALLDELATVSAVLNGLMPSVLRSYYGESYYGHASGYGDESRGVGPREHSPGATE